MPTGQLVQLIDTDERDDHADITVQFSCSARYITNMPANHGSSVRITLRLGPDCGSRLGAFPPEMPLVGGGGRLVTNARVESTVPGEIVLELSWARELDFVMAPTANGSGLRLRLIGTGRPKAAAVYVAEPEVSRGYAVNLESSAQAFDRAAVEAAAARLETQTYVSETNIEDEHWYRLRAGPFASRAEAQRVLQIAQHAYPRAWLAVNDETTDLTVVERAGAQTAASEPTDPPLPDDQRVALLRDARSDLQTHQYPQAIDLLSRLLRQPEYPARADAQELMGLVRERAGQLAQAQAAYEEYLGRYPNGAGAARVRSRLQSLAAASIAPKSTGEFGAASAADRWGAAGSVALGYQYGQQQTNSGGISTSAAAVNGALVYTDVLVRERGTRYDFAARADVGYTENLVASTGGSQDRTTAAFVEATDRQLGLTGRLGRQSLASQGIVGLFDGLFVGYQVNPTLSVSGAAGFPAYTSYSAFSTQQQFGTAAMEYTPSRSWIFDAYVFDQIESGFTDRRSIGGQARYSQPGRSAVILADYDVAFNQLNSVTFIGNLGIAQSWILGLDVDHRRSPLLELDNALLGQNATNLSALAHVYTPSQIRQLALDRTSVSDTLVLSASRSLGERWQFMADASALRLGGTPGSGGVDGTPSTGVDKNVSVQLAGSSILQASDLQIFGVRVDDSPIERSTALSWDGRFVLTGAFRFGPRFTVEQINAPSLGGRQTMLLPELRGDWTGRLSIFEVIAGYQLETQQALLQQQSLTGQPVTGTLDQRFLYFSATYRRRF
jgi:tetratricopeptide (TPR) repeat protein